MLPPSNRLKKQNKFEEIKKEGDSFFNKMLILRIKPNHLEENKIGFVVSKKVAKKASQRNKIKRRLREIVRSYLPIMEAGYDAIFFTRTNIKEASFEEIKSEIVNVLQKADLI